VSFVVGRWLVKDKINRRSRGVKGSRTKVTDLETEQRRHRRSVRRRPPDTTGVAVLVPELRITPSCRRIVVSAVGAGS
jgi:hypothetical protein